MAKFELTETEILSLKPLLEERKLQCEFQRDKLKQESEAINQFLVKGYQKRIETLNTLLGKLVYHEVQVFSKNEVLTILSCVNLAIENNWKKLNYPKLEIAYSWINLNQCEINKILLHDIYASILNKLNKKKKIETFKPVLDTLDNFKRSSKIVLYGLPDNFYKIRFITSDNKCFMLGLKGRLDIIGERFYNLHPNFIVSESKSPIVRVLDKENALSLLQNCNYYDDGPDLNTFNFVLSMLKTA